MSNNIFTTLSSSPNPVNIDEELKNKDMTLVKVRYYPYNCEHVLTCRKFLMNKRMQLSEFREKLRVRFQMNSDVDFEIFYGDEFDRITVTLDEELAIGLYQNFITNTGYRYATSFEIQEIKKGSSEVVLYGEGKADRVYIDIDTGKKYIGNDDDIDNDSNDSNDNNENDNDNDNDNNYERGDDIEMGDDDDDKSKKNLTIYEESEGKFIKNKTNYDSEIQKEKNKNFIKNDSEDFILAKVVYPENLIGRYGDYNEITFRSADLILNNVDSEMVWGTKIYTFDSDHLAAFLHAYPLIKLTDTPPDYDISAVVQILPGQSQYEASSSNGITSQTFEDYNVSFMFTSFTVKELSKGPETPPRKKRKVK